PAFVTVLWDPYGGAQSPLQPVRRLYAGHGLSETSREERRIAIDALAQSSAVRAYYIHPRMRGDAQSIADTVNDTELRLLTARKTMEELLASTTSSVAETLENTTGSINTALSSSTEQLQQVLTSTAEQVQSAVGSTTGQMETVLNAATGKMEAALSRTTNLLEDALKSTSEKVESQLGQFTGVAGSESEKAADALRQTQQTMILEM